MDPWTQVALLCGPWISPSRTSLGNALLIAHLASFLVVMADPSPFQMQPRGEKYSKVLSPSTTHKNPLRRNA